MKELLLRILTGVILIALMAGSILLGPVTFSSVLLLVYLLGVKELFGLLHKRGLSVSWFRAIPGALLIIIVYSVFQYQLSLLWLILPPALWLLTALRGGITLSGTLAFLWLAIPISSFSALGWMEKEPGFQYDLPLFLIAMVWINDTFAYVAGSLLGRHKMTPVLSPGKTWEGFTGGALITLLSGWLIWHFTGLSSLWAWLGIALLVSTLGLAGDLFESGLKRTVKVKNAGGLLPGHGGILDRFDSLLFVAPGALILIILFKLIQ
ncbi:MAG: phosphatidate cytidylyltransferase [Bacteroidales bacterium]|nr:phosphatidate cytidylyltransferase [Bacteroidales bacterium]